MQFNKTDALFGLGCGFFWIFVGFIFISETYDLTMLSIFGGSSFVISISLLFSLFSMLLSEKSTFMSSLWYWWCRAIREYYGIYIWRIYYGYVIEDCDSTYSQVISHESFGKNWFLGEELWMCCFNFGEQSAFCSKN